MPMKDSCHKYIPPGGKAPQSGSRNKKNISFIKGELKASDLVVHKRNFLPSLSQLERKTSKLFFLNSRHRNYFTILITTFSNEWIGFSEMKRSHMGVNSSEISRYSEAYQWSVSRRGESSYLLYSLMKQSQDNNILNIKIQRKYCHHQVIITDHVMQLIKTLCIHIFKIIFTNVKLPPKFQLL